jgi:hypothetical protein
MALAFGILMTINSPTLLNALSSLIPSKGENLYLARFLVSVSGFWGMVGLAVLFSFWHFPFFQTRVLLKGSITLLASTAFPVLAGYIFHFLTKKKAHEQDLLVYLLGVVFFVSGTALYFNLSPLFMSMVVGITYSNLTKINEKLYPLLLSTEKPLYIVFLVLIGGLWDMRLGYQVIILVILLFVLRWISFSLPIPIFTRILRFPFVLPPRFGLSFLSLGGIGIAFAISLKLVFPMELTDVFVSAALFMIIFSEFLGPLALKISFNERDKREKT